MFSVLNVKFSFPVVYVFAERPLVLKTLVHSLKQPNKWCSALDHHIIVIVVFIEETLLYQKGVRNFSEVHVCSVQHHVGCCTSGN